MFKCTNRHADVFLAFLPYNLCKQNFFRKYLRQVFKLPCIYLWVDIKSYFYFKAKETLNLFYDIC